MSVGDQHSPILLRPVALIRWRQVLLHFRRHCVGWCLVLRVGHYNSMLSIRPLSPSKITRLLAGEIASGAPQRSWRTKRFTELSKIARAIPTPHLDCICISHPVYPPSPRWTPTRKVVLPRRRSIPSRSKWRSSRCVTTAQKRSAREADWAGPSCGFHAADGSSRSTYRSARLQLDLSRCFQDVPAGRGATGARQCPGQAELERFHADAAGPTGAGGGAADARRGV